MKRELQGQFTRVEIHFKNFKAFEKGGWSNQSSNTWRNCGIKEKKKKNNGGRLGHAFLQLGNIRRRSRPGFTDFSHVL